MSSRTISRVQRSPTRSRAPARPQYWSYERSVISLLHKVILLLLFLMLASTEAHREDIVEEASELVIIGGGIAGLNALTVAGGYLSAHDRVVLVDSRPRAGGMWVDTYDFVQLHQPYPIFTAGNIAWQLGKPASHLA